MPDRPKVRSLNWSRSVDDLRRPGTGKGYLFEHFTAKSPFYGDYSFIRMTDCRGNHKTMIGKEIVAGVNVAKLRFKRLHEGRVLALLAENADH